MLDAIIMTLEYIVPTSATTKLSGLLGFVTAVPTTFAAVATGEWSAVAAGAAVTGIASVFAVIGVFRDKQIALLNRQIADLTSESQKQRDMRKAAEDLSDTWERRFHKIEGEMSDLKAWKDSNGCINAPDCPRRK